MKILALAVLALFAAPQEKSFDPGLKALAQDRNPKPLAIGSAAPDFDLPGADGKRYTLKDFAAQKLLLVLFDTVHCPTSQLYEARIKKIVDDYQGKGLGVLSISPNHPKSLRLDEQGYSDLDDTFEAMKIRARDHKFNFPFCFDGEPNTTSQAYGPKATPHAFLFDAERKLRYEGGIDDSEWADRVKVHHLRNALDAVLAGKDVPATGTRVFGCSTKWPNKQKEVEAYNARIAKEPVELKTDPALFRELYKGATGMPIVLHFWSKDDPSQLGTIAELHHMYRNRKAKVATVAVGAAADEEAVLAALRKQPSSHLNLLLDREKAQALTSYWDGQKLPFTVLIMAGHRREDAYRREGALDDVLQLRRAIVAGLNVEDRKR